MRYMIKQITATVFIMLSAVAYGYGQMPVEQVLYEIETNNLSLEARRKLVGAETIEARMGNSLEDPEVEFSNVWGDPSEIGKTQELNVRQSFDFPSQYSNRNKLAKLKAEQYGYEYAAYRQEVLLEAQLLCISIVSLREKDRYLGLAYENALMVVEMMEGKRENGDVSALDVSKAKFECANAMNALKMNEVELVAAEKQLVAMNGGKEIKVDSEIAGVMPEIPIYEVALNKYEESYPELKAVMAEMSVVNQQLKVSKGQSLPKITLGYKSTYGKGQKFKGFVVGMNIPMFGNRNNVKSAKARNAYAEAELERAKTDVESTIEELYLKEEILRNTLEQYQTLIAKDDAVGMLNRSLTDGHIILVDYFAQIQPILETYVALSEVSKEHRIVCATINMIDL